MKNFKWTIFYFVLAALLGLYIFYFERGPVANKDEVKKTKIFQDFTADNISEIKIENLTSGSATAQGPIDILKDEKGVWRIRTPRELDADETTLRTLLSSAGDLSTDTVIENPARLADFGLDSPTARCSFMTKGSSYVLLVGDKNPAGDSYYVKTPQKNNVYLVLSSSVDGLKKGLNDYRDHTFFKADPVLDDRLRVTKDGKVFALEKGKDGSWRITEPTQAGADDSKVHDLMSQITNLRVMDFVEDHPASLAKYGLAKPHAKIEVWANGSKTSQSILLGQKKQGTGTYFAKGADKTSVSTVGEYFVKQLDIKVTDYRNKSVMKFDSREAVSLTVKQGTKVFAYKKGDKDQWNAEGRVKAQDEATILIGQLSNTIISDFAGPKADTGLKNPVYRVEVGLDDKTTRIYQFGKREKDQVYLASDKNKEVYLVAGGVVSQLDVYFNTILTPVPAASTAPASK